MGVLPSVDRGIETAWTSWSPVALRGPRHPNGSLSGPVGRGPAPADCRELLWWLGLSGMPLATYIAHIRPRSTRFSPCSSRGLHGPWRLAAAADEQIQRLVVVLQAASHSSWFTSCLGLSDMPIPTPISHFPPQSTRFWRGVFLGFLPSVDHGVGTALSVAR